MNNLANHLAETFDIDRSAMLAAILEFNNDSDLSLLSEPAVAYKTKADLEIPYSSVTNDKILEQIESHLKSSTLISQILTETELTMKFLAESVFEMTPKTFAKYKNESTVLPKRFLELSLKLLGLYTLGNEVFGSTLQFNDWCDKPAMGLNFNIPKSYFSTVTGIEYITEELHRIMMGYPV